MLVLSRKIGEKIVVPACGLTITVVSLKGNRVRLGIAAPEDVRVDREEVWKRLMEEEEELEAATVS
jgi:carbon storage regulator